MACGNITRTFSEPPPPSLLSRHAKRQWPRRPLLTAKRTSVKCWPTTAERTNRTNADAARSVASSRASTAPTRRRAARLPGSGRSSRLGWLRLEQVVRGEPREVRDADVAAPATLLVLPAQHPGERVDSRASARARVHDESPTITISHISAKLSIFLLCERQLTTPVTCRSCERKNGLPRRHRSVSAFFRPLVIEL